MTMQAPTSHDSDGELHDIPPTGGVPSQFGSRKGSPTYPLNAWYGVRASHEIGRDLLAQKVCGLSMVFYRKEDDTPVALEDACWHRLAPLSLGKLHGDDLACPYHGLRYNPDGRCTFMPAQTTINPSAAVRSFPVVERYKFVWVWPGDPSLADPASIPDAHWNDDPAWTPYDGITFMDCDYRLVLDNLMDLTHEEFIHASTLGSSALSEAGFTVTHTDDTVTVSRWMFDIEPGPLWTRALGEKFPDYDGMVDRWQIIRYQAPSTIILDVGVAKAGSGAERGDRSQGVTGRTTNLLTPATDRSSIYLWAFSRDWDLENDEITQFMYKQSQHVFGEDEDMLIAQQRGIDAHPDHEFYDLNIDGGGLWVRRIIQRLVDLELESGLQQG